MLKKKIMTNCIIVIVILSLSIVVFWQYIIEGNLLLPKGVLSDILRVNLPTYYHMFDNLILEKNFWSWSMGLGTSMFAHADVYCDPFTYIIFLLGRENIPQMLIWSLIIKLIFEGLSFSTYLQYFKIHPFATIVASICYSFCGYSLIMGGNLALGTILVYAPLVFRGLEEYICNEKKKLLVFSLFITCTYSYYYFYTIGIISVIYVIFRCYKNKRELLFKLMGIAMWAIVTVGLSAFIFLPQIQLTLNSSRMNSGSDVGLQLNLFWPEIKTLATAFIRIFGNNLLGDGIKSPYVGYAYDSVHDYFQTDWYVTSLLIPLLFQYLYYNNKNRKKFLGGIVLVICATIFPVFSYVMNAFSTINYRWMFFLSFLNAVIVALSIDTIIRQKRINLKVYIASLVFSIAGILISLYGLGRMGEVSTKDIILNTWLNGKEYVIALCIVYLLFTVIIFVYRFIMQKNVKRIIICFLVLGIIFIEAKSNYLMWYGSENATSNYNEDLYCGYEDLSFEIIETIKPEGKEFFRINKSFDSVVDLNGIPSNNDAMAQKYFGLKSYCSVNNPNYITFLQELDIYVAVPLAIEYYKSVGVTPKDITGANLNYINGVGDNYQLMSYLGVKYFLTEEKGDFELFESIGEKDTIKIYENKANYPLAFVNYDIMSKDTFDKLNAEDKVRALLFYTIVETEEDTENIYLHDFSSVIEEAKNKQNKFEMINFNNDSVIFKINVDKDAKYLSFSIPYDEDWSVYIDGKKVLTHKVNIALLGAEISEGEHIVMMKYEPTMFYNGIIISFISGVCMVIYCYIKYKKSIKLI